MPWPRSNYIHPNQDNTLVASGSRIRELLALQVRPLHDYQHCCVDKVWSSSTRRTMKPLLAFPEALKLHIRARSQAICQVDYGVVGKRYD